jgi:hypothetical protein
MLNSRSTKDATLSRKMLVIDEFCRQAKLPKSFRLRLKHAVKFASEKRGFSWVDQFSLFK